MMTMVLLTITTTAEPATDLGFLLHKNPGRGYAPMAVFTRRGQGDGHVNDQASGQAGVVSA
jgi:hypothetical protein